MGFGLGVICISALLLQVFPAEAAGRFSKAQERRVPHLLQQVPQPGTATGSVERVSRNRTRLGVSSAYHNSRMVDPSERIGAAQKVLGTSISNGKRRAIHEAHVIGSGEIGRDGRSSAGVNADGTSNFTLGQLLRKAKILKKAGFGRSEIRKLFDHGIVGEPLELRTGKYEAEPVVATIMLSIKALVRENPIAFYELASKARDRDHQLVGNTGQLLKERGLLQRDGNLHESARNVVLAATEGEGLSMRLVNPLKPAGREASTNNAEQKTPHRISSTQVPQLKEYYAEVQKMATFIVETLEQHDVFVAGRLSESPNPFYDQIRFNGGVAVEYYYGAPSRIWTPLGQLSVTGSTGGDATQALEKITEKLGLREIVPEKTTNMGVYGPVMEVTQDLSGKKIPSVERLGGRKEFVEYDEARELWKQVAPEGRRTN